ncbi:MAG: S8 family serine peptidase, partial [Solobacterium sp.]|nr:S8 family serine peptidase [Solobacterium sp.]
MMKETLEKILKNKNTSRIVALVLSLLLCISIIGIIASAATVTKDDLEVTLVTDKEEYSASEPIIATISVKNKSDKTIDEVKLETLIPDGYHIEAIASATKNVEQLGVGEKVDLDVVLLPDDSVNHNEDPAKLDDETPSKAADEKPSTVNDKESSKRDDEGIAKVGSGESSKTNNNSDIRSSSSTTNSIFKKVGTTGVNNTAASTNSAPGKVIKSVNTGDESKLFFWIVISIIAIAGLVAINKRKSIESASRTLSIVVVCAILFCSISRPVVSAEDAVNNNEDNTIIVKEFVKSRGEEIIITGVVHYMPPNIDEAVNYKEVDENHIQKDPDSGLFYADNIIFVTSTGDEESLKIIVESLEGTIVGRINLTNDYEVELNRVSTLQQLEEICLSLINNDAILEASPCYLFETTTNYRPNDYDVLRLDKSGDWDISHPDGYEWNLEAINAVEAWDYRQFLLNVKVGVIDTSFFVEHEDLSNRIEAVYNDPDKGQAGSHGTNVAGIIAGEMNNGRGISGVSPNAKIVGYSIAGNYDDEYLKSRFHWSGTLTNYFNVKCALATLVIHGCKVINASLGINKWSEAEAHFDDGLDSLISAIELDSFIDRLSNQGYDFLIVQSAGNDARNAKNNGFFAHIKAPSIKEKVIIAGAITNDYYGNSDNKPDSITGYSVSSYSNFGDAVDIFAPGDQIYVCETTAEDAYMFMPVGGTSYAAPEVTGVAAMCFGVSAAITAKQVKEYIVNGTPSSILDDRLISDENELITPKTYPVLNAKSALESAFANQLGYLPQIPTLSEDQPSTPGDISGIDDPEPSQENNGHYYKVFDDDLTWDEAKSICESYGGHLVTITSQKENEIVSSLVEDGSMGAYWIGARRDDDWKWITGEDFIYSSWQPNRPDDNEFGMVIQLFNNNVYENQLGLWDDTWTDGDHAAGLREQGYVCEWDSEASYQAFLQRQPNAYEINMESSIEIDGKMETLTEQSFILDGHR